MRTFRTHSVPGGIGGQDDEIAVVMVPPSTRDLICQQRGIEPPPLGQASLGLSPLPPRPMPAGTAEDDPVARAMLPPSLGEALRARARR